MDVVGFGVVTSITGFPDVDCCVVPGGLVPGVVPSGGLVTDGVVPGGLVPGGLVTDGVVPSGGLV